MARLDGIAVGCGGVAMFDDYAEVKRMYTRPVARGRGVAKALLHRIEHEARKAGKSVLSLETGIPTGGDGLYEGKGFGNGVHLANMWQCLPATLRRASFSRRPFPTSTD